MRPFDNYDYRLLLDGDLPLERARPLLARAIADRAQSRLTMNEIQKVAIEQGWELFTECPVEDLQRLLPPVLLRGWMRRAGMTPEQLEIALILLKDGWSGTIPELLGAARAL